MHFQKHEHYGLLLMGELANSHQSDPLCLAEVSRRHGVSVPFLKKIVRSLRASGLVQSKEGAGGGYTLTQKPESISLWEIISSLNTNSADAKETSIGCPVNKSCLPQHIRTSLYVAIENRLRAITLKEVSE